MYYCTKCQQQYDIPVRGGKELADCIICKAKNEACYSLVHIQGPDKVGCNIADKIQGAILDRITSTTTPPSRLPSLKEIDSVYNDMDAAAESIAKGGASAIAPKLIPFDLSRALAGDPVVTRDGSKVISIVHFPQSYHGRIVAQVVGSTSPFLYYEDGKYCKLEVHDYDLLMAPKITTVYVNLFFNPENKGGAYGGFTCSQPYVNESDRAAAAFKSADKKYIGTYPIQIQL